MNRMVAFEIGIVKPHFSGTISVRDQSYGMREKCSAGVFTEFSEPVKEARDRPTACARHAAP
jgi:hypothetical protein